MGTFLIEPQKSKKHYRVYDNVFLWSEKNIYIMANHRLALWCWLQCDDVFKNEHSFIHIDRHTDARKWEGPGEQECLEKILSNFSKLQDIEVFESFQCKYRKVSATDRDMRPCITYDNFVHLVAEAGLFKHYHIYASVGDWHTSLDEKNFSFNKRIAHIYNLADDIKSSSGKCIVDVDLDFFDDLKDYIKKVSDDGLLIAVFRIIAKHLDEISMLTISINDIPGDQLWDKRMRQLSIIKDILGLDVPVPVME